MRLFCSVTPLLVSFCFIFLVGCNPYHYSTPPRVLVFSKTAGFRHASIPKGVAALRTLCASHGIMVDSTEENADFNEKNLKKYAAVVFLSTTGDVLTPEQETAFERYIQAGGGFVGIHAATDTEYGWRWYGGLVGGYFQSHPKIQDAQLIVKDHHHPSTEHLREDTWTRNDEWYNFKDLNPNVKVLLSIDEKSYEGGQNGENHPMCWYHQYDGGRAWYTAGGHTDKAFEEPAFLAHLLGGIRYAIGDNQPVNYNKCRTPAMPDPTRFTKTVLAEDLTEPMEIDMFPDGKVILIERRGAIKLFDPSSGILSVAHKLEVYSEEEDGLMGCAIDPNYAKNSWIYLYYSPVGKSVNRLSRFVFRGDSLDRASEKTILEVVTQRDECCHTGGSIEFDADGNLFLSTGDNTNPFASDGFAPIDESPGRSAWDAQKSSGNTNDLRGKILRIKPHDDGSYSCPPGNLFNGDSGIQGRPEIYVMGCRNPFRISIDNRRKYLFWGEVGPDAGEPDTMRGPQGHDEVNRARSSGFFGWPYFVGNNKPYYHHNFVTGARGEKFDPAHPENHSPNNTGSTVLPPAQPAFIWYPYGNSAEFPLVRNGGRNAMAGPVYYCDQYPEATRFPAYFDGKLITYDWMRNWMMAVTMDSVGNFSRMEPFCDSLKFSRPMDMLIDKNGSLWVLEYGTQWFSRNPDARLSRIDYNRGNRPPQPVLNTDKVAGAAPCAIRFDFSKTRDYDGDRLLYEFDFGDGATQAFQHTIFKKKSGIAVANAAGGDALSALEDTTGRSPTDRFGYIYHYYQNPGTYTVKLKVTDPAGAFAELKREIRIGNEPPKVYWDLNGHNRSFYQPGTTINYTIQVNDREDGTLANGQINANWVSATIDYLAQGFDITLITQGHQTAVKATEYARGKILMERSDCKTCHAIDRKINGPSYQDIAQRYRGNEFAVRSLSAKIIQGGSGVWGATAMSAHPQITPEDAAEMVQWILSLGDPVKPSFSIPVKGPYTLAAPADPTQKGPSWPGTYIFKATYKDRGTRHQQALESGEALALRPAYQQAEKADSISQGVIQYAPGKDTVVLRDMKDGAFILFKRTDLTGLMAISAGIGGSDKNNTFGGGKIEIHLDHPKGPMIGSALIPASPPALKMSLSEVNIPIRQDLIDQRFHDLYLVMRNENAPSSPIGALDWVRFELK